MPIAAFKLHHDPGAKGLHGLSSRYFLMNLGLKSLSCAEKCTLTLDCFLSLLKLTWVKDGKQCTTDRPRWRLKDYLTNYLGSQSARRVKVYVRLPGKSFLRTQHFDPLNAHLNGLKT